MTLQGEEASPGMDIQGMIQSLGLAPLEWEGGYFRQTFKSPETVTVGGKKRSMLTSIYYLLTKTSFSALHRLTSTEVFNYYAGARAEMFLLDPDAGLTRYVLGTDLQRGEVPQVVVPPGVWQGSRILSEESRDWTFLGVTVAPGFEYEDFELGKRAGLLARFPQYREIILGLTRE